MFNPDQEQPAKPENEDGIVLSQELVNIDESINELQELGDEDFSKNIVYTREMAEGVVRERIQTERFWNLLTTTFKELDYQPPTDRKTQILDLGCSVCEEKKALHAFFGGEANPYYNKNDNVQITGVDLDEEAIELAVDSVPRNQGQNFNFLIGDASQLEEVAGLPGKADVVLVRHQQMSKSNYNKDNIVETELWQKIFDQGIERLENNGVLIITSYTESEHRDLLEYLGELNNVKVVKEGENQYAENIGAGGTDKYYAIVKLKESSN